MSQRPHVVLISIVTCLMLIVALVIHHGEAAATSGDASTSQQRQLGCVWRSKNTSLYCQIFDNFNTDHNVDSIRQYRDSTKFVDLECVDQESDRTSSTKRSGKGRLLNNDDYLDDEVGVDPASKSLWTQLEFIRVRGCPLHQVSVDPDSSLNSVLTKRPLLRSKDLKSDDLFSDFLQTTLGGRVDWARLRGLDLASSGLNRPLTTRTKTFCELSDSLYAINLSSNFFTTISDIFASAFSASDKCAFGKLTTLNMADNQIRTIRATDLLFATNLETLDVSSNRIERIEPSSLRHLASLKTLQLSENQLSSLTPSPWSNLTQLRELYLQGNKLDRLPEFSKMSQLVLLNLSRNALTTIDDNSFSDLSSLIALDLSLNRIVQVSDEAFAGLKSLQVLTLAHNRLQTLSANVFAHLATLHALVLSHNVIENVQQNAFEKLSDLRSLSLDHNRIKSLHKDVFEKSTSLRDLSLAANLFRHFPHAALKPAGGSLQTLDFGENLLLQLHPTALSGLDRLYGLRLAGNKLRNLTENVFQGVENLKMLNLASNGLQNISKKAFSALKDLKALRLDDNQLEDINGLLMNQHHLQWLNVSHNQLQWFDYAFIPKSVLWLSLRSNLIEELANYYEMRSGFQLSHLDVGQNKLVRLDRLAMQSSIQEFLADRNLITELSANTFSDLSNVTKINLTGNRLERFPLNALAIQLDLSVESAEIYLSGNPLKCDCEMEWIQRVDKLATSSPREFPRIADWSEVTCSLNNRQINLEGTDTKSLVLPVSTVQASEFICQYSTHCYALCMCCEFFACDCRMKCSDGCDCYHDTTWSANIIHCGRRRHSDIPKFIPMDATSIYLDGNALGALTGDEFIGRKHLTSLYLNASSITGISNKTFKGLTELITLHLEQNLITNLTGGEFDELTALQEIHLNDNRLTWIADETFAALRNLRILRLHNNRISVFPVWTTMRSLTLLQSVSLSGNPWSCQCDFVQKLQLAVSEAEPETVSDFSQLQCTSGALTSDIGKFNLSCADVMAVSFRSGDTVLSDIMPIIAVVAAAVVIVVSLIILAVAVRKPVGRWLSKKYGGVGVSKASTATSGNGPAPSLGNRGQNKYVYDCLIHTCPLDEEFVRQSIVTRLEAARRTPYRVCVFRSGTRTEDLRLAMDKAAAVIVMASESYLQSSSVEKDMAAILDNNDNNRRTTIIVAMDIDASKKVRQISSKVKTVNILTWSSIDFWSKLLQRLPEASDLVDKSSVDNVDKQKYDDEMWTYLKGVKVEASLLEPNVGGSGSDVLTDLHNSFSGPSGESSLSTHSTDNSAGSLTYGGKNRRSATLSHGGRGGEKSPPTSATTMQSRRPPRQPSGSSRPQLSGSGRTSTSRRSDTSSRIFENPLDQLPPGGLTTATTSDSDYMSVSDSLLRNDRMPVGVGGHNAVEPIYHTLEDDDDDGVVLDKAVHGRRSNGPTSRRTNKKKKETEAEKTAVYINADLEVVYPPFPTTTAASLRDRNLISDDDLDDAEAEFEQLLQGRMTSQQPQNINNNNMLEPMGGDEYENGFEDEDDDDFFRRRRVGGYVPSPAPGSYPRRWQQQPQQQQQQPFSTPKTNSRLYHSPADTASAYSPRTSLGRHHYRSPQQQQQQQQQQYRRGSQQQQQQQFDGYLI